MSAGSSSVPIAVLLDNYSLGVQDSMVPSLWCLRSKPSGFGGDMPCWGHVFANFYDDPHELTLGRLLQVAAEHEAEVHLMSATDQ